jgi:hypothetical protein
VDEEPPPTTWTATHALDNESQITWIDLGTLGSKLLVQSAHVTQQRFRARWSSTMRSILPGSSLLRRTLSLASTLPSVMLVHVHEDDTCLGYQQAASAEPKRGSHCKLTARLARGR